MGNNSHSYSSPYVFTRRKVRDDPKNTVNALLNHKCQPLIDDDYDNCDEIVIATAYVIFSIRYLDSLPKLKEQYDNLINKLGQQSISTLHTEDSFADLPSLEVDPL